MSLPLTVPVAGTAVRPLWPELPVAVRHRIEGAIGAAVVAAASQDSGFTPGFASRLRLADGRRVFVKATDARRPWLLDCYRLEAAKLALIPSAVPAPRLTLVLDEPIDGKPWLILVFDDIDGRPPLRPWQPDEARAALSTATIMAEVLTPPPPGWAWARLADEIFDSPPDWSSLRAKPDWAAYADALRAYADVSPELLAGSTLAHLDCRDDNLIMDRDGRAWVCDWNFPAVGPQWTDAVCLAISMYGDGLDVEVLLAETGLVSDQDRDGVDCLLAVLTTYFLLQSVQPPNPTSPYLRIHQTWYAQASGTWLKQRLGWT